MKYVFADDLNQLRTRVNAFLQQQLQPFDSTPAQLADAMRYGILLGGKRLRPFLVYAGGRMLQADLKTLDYAAAAIEAIHSYSLIHDDLPAMDNDTLRRGQKTCHIEYDEATAILAGDALQAFAFECLSRAPDIHAEQKVALVRILAQASGGQGMCLGQSLDLTAEQRAVSLAFLQNIHRNKTGALISAAVEMGFLCSPHYRDQTLRNRLIRYAQAIGLAFQVQDDILDITADSTTLGKNAGSDLALDKSTYPKLLGLDGAKQKAEQLIAQAKAELQHLNFDTEPLVRLADYIVQRNH
ncbi:geranyl transferase [Chelonobacter oris]|uniref:Geranyl transferase n=1 Tax=Chelonobacter oris TaxID=505317 RepID=A0A0A3BCR5_9PAST|nr:(2E,6E)-farnesyl diphosphate synthase [Chelonobacter oris]KGQ71324.1 geranyl transferase [Chelonobacter oris]MDH2999987.1 geranyl transferase [Chelonobacter oris]